MHSELSDYIQKHKISLPDLECPDNNHIGIDDDSDEIEQEFQSIYANSADIETNYSDISDNWLFRKPGTQHCMKGSASSIASASSPVGMLVPSPTHDCPTLIGNRIADETSDLSENGSDVESLNGEHSDDELNRGKLNSHDLPHVLVESKTLIGGKNEMNSFERSKAALFDLLEPDSLVSEQSLTGQSPAISEAKNNLILIENRPEPTINIAVKRNDLVTTMEHSKPSRQESADLLIKFDSLEADNVEIVQTDANNVDILSNNNATAFNPKYETNQRYAMKHSTSSFLTFDFFSHIIFSFGIFSLHNSAQRMLVVLLVSRCVHIGFWCLFVFSVAHT